ncbi:hypothetical protein EIP91_009621, partial [Steccherinum ochraceum]
QAADRVQDKRIMHEVTLAEMEAEMETVFQQKVSENEAILKQSEAELYSLHREMKEALEKQRLELEDRKCRIQTGRPLTPEKPMASHSLLTAYDIQRFIQSSLDQSQNTPLTAISIASAQTILDELWKVLDSAALPLASSNSHFSLYRTKLRKLSLKLSIAHDILPTTLVLKGVQCTESVSVGAGAFADVYIGSFRGEKVALKRLRVYLMATEGQKQTTKQLFYRESLLWKNLVHPSIVPFVGVAEDVFPGTICMVMPWMENGSLKHYLESMRGKKELVDAAYVAAIEKWIADGLMYLHDEGLVHGDLHGGNVLIDGEGNARLADFGMALVSESTAYAYASVHGGGAIRWKAPELIDPEEFGIESSRPTPASDVFSFACMSIELYSGAPPFPDLTANQVARRYVKGQRPDRPKLPDGTDTRMADPTWALTQACWAHQPADRPVTRDVVARMAAIANIPADVVLVAARLDSIPVESTVPLSLSTEAPVRATPSAPSTWSALVVPPLPPPLPPAPTVAALGLESPRMPSDTGITTPSGSQLPMATQSSRPSEYRNVDNVAFQSLLQAAQNYGLDETLWSNNEEDDAVDSNAPLRVRWPDESEESQRAYVVSRLRDSIEYSNLPWYQEEHGWVCEDGVGFVSYEEIAGMLRKAGVEPNQSLITAMGFGLPQDEDDTSDESDEGEAPSDVVSRNDREDEQKLRRWKLNAEQAQEAFIKARLRNFRACDSGLEWSQASDAWRCEDRKHFVSFNTVEMLVRSDGMHPVPRLTTADGKPSLIDRWKGQQDDSVAEQIASWTKATETAQKAFVQERLKGKTGCSHYWGQDHDGWRTRTIPDYGQAADGINVEAANANPGS